MRVISLLFSRMQRSQKMIVGATIVAGVLFVTLSVGGTNLPAWSFWGFGEEENFVDWADPQRPCGPDGCDDDVVEGTVGGTGGDVEWCSDIKREFVVSSPENGVAGIADPDEPVAKKNARSACLTYLVRECANAPSKEDKRCEDVPNCVEIGRRAELTPTFSIVNRVIRCDRHSNKDIYTCTAICAATCQNIIHCFQT